MAKAGLKFDEKDEWYTPKEIIKKFGKFDYDPATTEEKAAEFGIKNYDTIKTDGLKNDWSKYNRIWVNPPFTAKYDFLKKVVATLEEKSDIKIFMVFPADSMFTMKFHEIVGKNKFKIWIPNGRIEFIDFSGQGMHPAFGTAIFEFGKVSNKTWRQLKIYG